MTHCTVDLYEHFGIARPAGGAGYLAVYAHEPNPELPRRTRPAALVIPGGGYGMVSSREGEPVAVRFFAAGYCAFALRYTVHAAYPVPLVEAAMAAAYIRERARAYRVDPSMLVAVGFSAGGHLAGMLATLFGEDCVRAALGSRNVRPDAAVLSYPVVTLERGVTHEGSASIISGGDEELRGSLSLETRVTAKSAPCFLWHTTEDNVVPVENSLRYFQACLKCGVPCEAHFFEKGGHGYSVASIETEATEEGVRRVSHVRVWADMALEWLARRGFGIG